MIDTDLKLLDAAGLTIEEAQAIRALPEAALYKIERWIDAQEDAAEKRADEQEEEGRASVKDEIIDALYKRMEAGEAITQEFIDRINHNIWPVRG